MVRIRVLGDEPMSYTFNSRILHIPVKEGKLCTPREAFHLLSLYKGRCYADIDEKVVVNPNELMGMEGL